MASGSIGGYPRPTAPPPDTLQAVANETLAMLEECHNLLDQLEGGAQDAATASPAVPGVVHASVLARTKAIDLRSRLESLTGRIGYLGS